MLVHESSVFSASSWCRSVHDRRSVLSNRLQCVETNLRVHVGIVRGNGARAKFVKQTVELAIQIFDLLFSWIDFLALLVHHALWLQYAPFDGQRDVGTTDRSQCFEQIVKFGTRVKASPFVQSISRLILEERASSASHSLFSGILYMKDISSMVLIVDVIDIFGDFFLATQRIEGQMPVEPIPIAADVFRSPP